MRTETIIMGGQTVVINEMKIKDIKNNILPKLEPAWDKIMQSESINVVDAVSQQIKDIVPELSGIDFDECYSSEIEAFWEAWINVNFFGLKRLYPLLSSLPTMESLKSGSD